MRLHTLISAATLLAAVPAIAPAQQVTAPAQSQTTVVSVIPLDRVVAVVGDVPITQSDVQERVLAKRQEGAQLPTDSVSFHAFLLGVVNELVEEELLLQKAKDL